MDGHFFIVFPSTAEEGTALNMQKCKVMLMVDNGWSSPFRIMVKSSCNPFFK